MVHLALENPIKAPYFRQFNSFFIRSCSLRAHRPLGFGSARLCYTWVIPLHFRLTTWTPCHTIFLTDTLVRLFEFGVSSPRRPVLTLKWPLPTRTRVFRNRESRAQGRHVQSRVPTRTFQVLKTFSRNTRSFGNAFNAQPMHLHPPLTISKHHCPS
jgi:hypothetical protein